MTRFVTLVGASLVLILQATYSSSSLTFNPSSAPPLAREKLIEIRGGWSSRGCFGVMMNEVRECSLKLNSARLERLSAVPLRKLELNVLKRNRLDLRGGAYSDDGDESSTDVDDDDDDEDESDEESDDQGSDFDESLTSDSFTSRIMTHYRTTPPVTKVFLTSSFLLTLYGYITGGNYPSFARLDYGAVMRGQLWRLLTGFMNYGPFGISYLLTTQFVWTYMSAIEKLNYAKPTEFFIMMLTGMGTMLVTYGVFGFEPNLMAHNLSTFFVYIW